jgi:hypothetical protein
MLYTKMGTSIITSEPEELDEIQGILLISEEADTYPIGDWYPVGEALLKKDAERQWFTESGDLAKIDKIKGHYSKKVPRYRNNDVCISCGADNGMSGILHHWKCHYCGSENS